MLKKKGICIMFSSLKKLELVSLEQTKAYILPTDEYFIKEEWHNYNKVKLNFRNLLIFPVKINFRRQSEKYLTNYFSRCSIIILICSLILSLSTWVIFLSFSGGTNDTYIFQIVIQVFITVIICLLLEGIIYLYLRNKVIAELAIYVEEIRVNVFVKVVEKSIGFFIAIILVVMQFYRMNKFWITHSTS